ncbi:TIGR02391 family protein [Anabaena cylindrica FACHB-243]|uniref:Conserved hypothetical protein CHP02391 domain-containing protein n=1 Tax=Anabaena cylindrica (strain ATCC 27899 / PCC 7122) TaxID=272123 RepID=K9Z9W5_ANACC|nr:MULTISPECIES: TIGR02391 family protein [Anabaena]AFZ55966.1 hypothetical protein Anacy_0364 [Anabaena cylindrica PCC 7122]MBD2421386.1 TIGR02391 family protein [Anabaena cylindrica FACHB-243]MBY5284326.1 TIGR02391 family protein [Anabaena sp. CCAP 1446/1C]MBY5306232.1 TIGR02391 family protein [Anabaena sp. CCAP 1446/1C]MCM2406719.1 TIGR02391 family protein [Anabaena sp. CCAP 1446/1C]
MDAKLLLSEMINFKKSIDSFYESYYQYLYPKKLINKNPLVNQFELLIKIESKQMSAKYLILKPYIIYFANKLFGENTIFLTTIERYFGSSHDIKSLNLLYHQICSKLEKIISVLESEYPNNDLISNLNYEIQANTVDDLINSYLNYLHLEIQNASSKLYLDGYYHQSIEAAIKAINQYIRDKTGLTLDGATLIDKTFGVTNPILSFSDLSTETLKNEQIGFMDMLKGFIKGVRNPLAHNPAKSEDPQKAFEYLVMASLFCKRIDDAKKFTP